MIAYIKSGKIPTKEDFPILADLLLNKTGLEVKMGSTEKIFRICEIEFYLYNDTHQDKCTHCHNDQLGYGNWYFHKYHNGTLKNGTWKGLDIALGSKEENTYCGILIRSIFDPDIGIIEGPCRTVNRILEFYNSDINTFVSKFNSKTGNISAENNSRNFTLCDMNGEQEEIYCGPRIGLNNNCPEYSKRAYRYLIGKDLIKKDRKSLTLVKD